MTDDIYIKESTGERFRQEYDACCETYRLVPLSQDHPTAPGEPPSQDGLTTPTFSGSTGEQSEVVPNVGGTVPIPRSAVTTSEQETCRTCDGTGEVGTYLGEGEFDGPHPCLDCDGASK